MNQNWVLTNTCRRGHTCIEFRYVLLLNKWPLPPSVYAPQSSQSDSLNSKSHYAFRVLKMFQWLLNTLQIKSQVPSMPWKAFHTLVLVTSNLIFEHLLLCSLSSSHLYIDLFVSLASTETCLCCQKFIFFNRGLYPSTYLPLRKLSSCGSDLTCYPSDIQDKSNSVTTIILIQIITCSA